MTLYCYNIGKYILECKKYERATSCFFGGDLVMLISNMWMLVAVLSQSFTVTVKVAAYADDYQLQ